MCGVRNRYASVFQRGSFQTGRLRGRHAVTTQPRHEIAHSALEGAESLGFGITASGEHKRTVAVIL